MQIPQRFELLSRRPQCRVQWETVDPRIAPLVQQIPLSLDPGPTLLLLMYSLHFFVIITSNHVRIVLLTVAFFLFLLCQ